MSTMKNTPPRMFAAAPPPTNENRKLVLMSVAVMLLMVALVTMQKGLGKSKAKSTGRQPTTAQSSISDIAIPELDLERLAGLVADDNPESRQIQEEAGRELLLDYAARLGAPHYRAMQAPELTAELSAEILADPGSWRGKPVRMHGYIQDIRTKSREDGREYLSGTMILDDDSYAHFAFEKFTREGLGLGSVVRVDGIIMKAFLGEVGERLEEAPLVIGRVAERSYSPIYTEDFGDFTESELANIVNDDFVNGVGEVPFAEKWKLLARASYGAEDVDWENAPVLDKALLAELLANGDDYRGMPLRLPLDGVAIIDIDTDYAPENPARINQVTEGWIYENEWSSTVGMIHFFSPFGLDYAFDDKTVAKGHGFFFKTHAYQASEAGLRRTPIIVLAELNEVVRAEETMVRYLMVAVAGGSIAIGAMIFFLLRRDAKSSDEFQKRLAARKRKRPAVDSAT
ncbi:MAG: hypothetical protein ACI89E_002099 [Planctomycetota bacterium]|jgi:hypothetical protein